MIQGPAAKPLELVDHLVGKGTDKVRPRAGSGINPDIFPIALALAAYLFDDEIMLMELAIKEF